MKVLAPGKIILSGEHAVVYGKPALALAVNRYISITMTAEISSGIFLSLPDLSHQSHHNFSELLQFKNQMQKKYQLFKKNELKIRDILLAPVDLVLFVCSLFFSEFNHLETHGVKLELQTEIPIGCGMGSSAAVILSILQGLAHYFQVEISRETILRLALEAENMQHGYSSGLDLKVIMQGGCVYVNENQILMRTIPTLPLYLVNTGTPQTTTGECVAFAADSFERTQIANEFAVVTSDVDTALQINNLPKLRAAVQTNHELLKAIGVVPQKVQKFISEVEKNEGAAKICGAGAVAGENAGMVLVVSENVAAVKNLCALYRYDFLPITCAKRGVHVI